MAALHRLQGAADCVVGDIPDEEQGEPSYAVALVYPKGGLLSDSVRKNL
jgi:hypothetical protein